MKIFKKVLVGGPIVLLAFAILFSCAPASENNANVQSGDRESSLDRILEAGVIRIGTTGDYYMSFIDSETGERKGMDIDVVTKLAADMGVEIEWVPTDWANLISGVAAGKYDITTGASYNPGRAKTAGYTLPYISAATVPLTLASNLDRFQSWDDVDQPSVTAAVRLGTVFEDQARSLVPNSNLSLIQAPATEYQELLAGKADVAITSLFDSAELISRYSELAVASVPPRAKTPIGLLTPRGDIELINYINVWMSIQEENGFLEETRSKWNLQ